MYQNDNERDLLLIAQIKNGDMQALAALYSRYYKTLLLVARTNSPTKEHAEDVVIEIFLAILRKGNQIDIRTDVKSYLRKAVWYRSVTIYNQTKREKSVLKKYESEITDYLPSVDRMEATEMQYALQTALRLLPAQLKKAVELSYLEEKEKKDIALELGVSPSTVTKYISEALKRLAQYPPLKIFQS